MTAADFHAAAEAGFLDEAICRRCGRMIVRGWGDWLHIDPQNDLIRMCRAASFLRDSSYPDGSAWDETLKRSWKATP